jgi:ABC-type branched-subunit amino acid transport system substrate-binding protein
MFDRRQVVCAMAALALGQKASGAVPGAQWVFGQSAPLSGAFSSLGIDYRNGTLLAFDEANDFGGVAGKSVKLVTLDDAYNVDRAVANANVLVKKHEVHGFLNHMFTNTVRASLPVAVAAGVPSVGPYSGHPDLYRNDQPLLFVTRASFAEELAKILNYVTDVGLRRVALVYYDNKVGEEFARDVRTGLAARGRSLAISAGMPIGGKPDAASAAVAGKNADAVILGVSGGDAVAFVRAQGQLAKRPIYLARSLVGSKQLHDELGPLGAGIVVSQLVPSPFRSSANLVRDYRRLLQQRDSTAQPSFVEFEGFINARLVLSALRRTNGATPQRDTLTKALRNLGRVDLGGYAMEFSENNRVGSHFVELTMLRKDGSFAQ